MNYSTDFNLGTTQKSLFFLFWVTGVILNLTSTVLLIVAVKTKTSWANILLLSLALTDTCVISLATTLGIPTLFMNDILYDTPVLCYFQYVVLNWYILMSFWLVVCISCDQYLAVSHPFTYNTKILRHPKRSQKIIVITLLTLTFVSLLPSIGSIALQVDITPLIPPTFCYYDLQFDETSNIVLIAINGVLMGSLMLVDIVITTVLAIRLYIIFLRDKENAARGANHQMTLFAKLSVIITIFFVSSAFLFEAVHILHLLEYNIDRHLDYLTLCIFLSNTLLFPCMFILVRASVRQIFQNFVKKVLKACNITTGGQQNNTKEKIELKKT